MLSMSSEPTEVQLARLEERLKTLLNQMEFHSSSAQKTDARIDQMNHLLVLVGNRVEKVESSLALASPTIQEFVVFKHKVLGAGLFGKYIYLLAGALVALVYSMRAEIIAWLSKH